MCSMFLWFHNSGIIVCKHHNKKNNFIKNELIIMRALRSEIYNQL